MEFIEGQTLQSRIAAGDISPKEVIHLGAQLSDALTAAHLCGVIHRDLKPGNLMVRPDGTLKVLDFGLAKHLHTSSPAGPSGDSTQSGVVVGTLPYLTPEQLRGEAAEERSDIHCVGAILYELSTRRRPFAGEGTALLATILNEVPTPPRSINPKVPYRLQSVIMKCLEKSMEARFQSAADLGSTLTVMRTIEARREFRRNRRRRRRWRIYMPTAVAAVVLVAALTAMFLPGNEGIAVLPFDSLGPGGQEYYAAAVSDQLFSKLVQLSELPVIPRTSARAVDKDQSLQQIAKSLGVDIVVEGTVLRADGMIRVSISVSRIERSKWQPWKHVAKTIYAGERSFAESELFRELGTFATQIAERLVSELDPEARGRLANQPDIDPQAFEQYARGRFELSRRTPQAFTNAIQFFEASIGADSTFAAAYAGLTDCYSLLGSLGYDLVPPTEAMPRAREYARKALHYDDNLAEAHTALAHILHNYDWDWAGAREEFERAITLAPGDATPYQWYSYYFATMGQLDEAIHWQKKGLENSPNSAVARAALVRMYYYKRDYPKALEALDCALERDQNFMPAIILLGTIYIELGRLEEAREVFQAGHVVTRGAAVFEAGLGAVYAESGDMDEAKRVLKDLAARQSYVPAYYSAAIYLKLGDRERALQFLGKAVEERSEAVLYLAVDPLVDDLRTDLRLARLMHRVGLPVDRLGQRLGATQ